MSLVSIPERHGSLTQKLVNGTQQGFHKAFIQKSATYLNALASIHIDAIHRLFVKLRADSVEDELEDDGFQLLAG